LGMNSSCAVSQSFENNLFFMSLKKANISWQLTEDEIKLYTPIEFDLDEYKSDVGVDTLLHPTKIGTLTHRWRFPCLSLHGIEGINTISVFYLCPVFLKIRKQLSKLERLLAIQS